MVSVYKYKDERTTRDTGEVMRDTGEAMRYCSGQRLANEVVIGIILELPVLVKDWYMAIRNRDDLLELVREVEPPEVSLTIQVSLNNAAAER